MSTSPASSCKWAVVHPEGVQANPRLSLISFPWGISGSIGQSAQIEPPSANLNPWSKNPGSASDWDVHGQETRLPEKDSAVSPIFQRTGNFSGGIVSSDVTLYILFVLGHCLFWDTLDFLQKQLYFRAASFGTHQKFKKNWAVLSYQVLGHIKMLLLR